MLAPWAAGAIGSCADTDCGKSAGHAAASSIRVACAAMSSSRARITSSRTWRAGSTDRAVGYRVAVQREIEPDSEKSEIPTDTFADECGALADPRREHERIQPRRCGGHRRDRPGDAIHEDIDREPGLGLAGQEGPLELAHVARAPTKCFQAGLGVERVLQPGRIEAAGGEEVEQRARVDRAGTRRHRHTLERAEPHRRVDRPAAADSCHGATTAQMAHDEPLHRHLLGRPLDGEPVEAVAANSPLLAPQPRHGVRRCLRRNRRVETRVEDSDLRHAGKMPLGLLDRRQGRWIVERRKLFELHDLLPHVRVDHDRRAEARPAVDDAVRDRRHLSRFHRLQGIDPHRGVVGRDQIELQARGAGIDDEDVQPAAQVQALIAGSSSPCSRVYARARSLVSCISWRRCAALSARPGTRSITSSTR